MHVCMHACMHAWMYVCVCVCVYAGVQAVWLTGLSWLAMRLRFASAFAFVCVWHICICGDLFSLFFTHLYHSLCNVVVACCCFCLYMCICGDMLRCFYSLVAFVLLSCCLFAFVYVCANSTLQSKANHCRLRMNATSNEFGHLYKCIRIMTYLHESRIINANRYESR